MPDDQPGKGYLGLDPEELAKLTPAERARLYKERQRALGVGAPAQGGQQAPPAAPKASAATPAPPPPPAAPAGQAAASAPAEAAPAAPPPPELSPEELARLSPAERAAYYKARQRAAGFVPPRREAGAAPAARPPAAPAAPARPAAPAAPAAGARPAPAAPPKAPPQPAEPPREPPYLARLRQVAPELTWAQVHKYDEVTIPRERLLEVARVARDELKFDYLSAVTAVDYRDHFLLIYHLYSFDYRAQPGRLVLQVKLAREAYPVVDSVTPIWPGAEFQEREVWDLMGIKFAGHPDLRRILLADDFPGHPLRKDFVFDYEYTLVRHLRSGVLGQAPVPYVPPHERATLSAEPSA